MWSEESELDDAITALGLSEAVVRLDESEAARVTAELLERFVVGRPRVWWHALREPVRRSEHPAGDGHLLLRRLPATGVCWLILAGEGDSPPVYRMDPVHVPALLSECPFFEYYAMDQRGRWLVCENGHNQVMVCGDLQL